MTGPGGGVNMELTKRDIKNIRLALLEAKDSYLALIDAYTTQWTGRGNKAHKIISCEDRKQTQKWERKIVAFKRLRIKLSTMLPPRSGSEGAKMKIEIKLADPKYCNGCPELELADDAWWTCDKHYLIPQESLLVERPAKCIEENGE